MHIPDPPRSSVVRRLPRRLVGDLMISGSVRDPTYFERIYTESADPYGFERNDFERLKFDRVLELCGDGPFERVLEIGCSVGSFTARLAPRCRELVAVDISHAAVARAAERVAAYPGVRCEVRNVPADLPSEPFDLIVASDVLYYWTRADVESAARRFAELMVPGGALVAAHYIPPWGVLLTGDEVHDILRDTVPLQHVHAEQIEFGAGRPYRLDRYERR